MYPEFNKPRYDGCRQSLHIANQSTSYESQRRYNHVDEQCMSLEQVFLRNISLPSSRKQSFRGGTQHYKTDFSSILRVQSKNYLRQDCNVSLTSCLVDCGSVHKTQPTIRRFPAKDQQQKYINSKNKCFSTQKSSNSLYNPQLIECQSRSRTDKKVQQLAPQPLNLNTLQKTQFNICSQKGMSKKAKLKKIQNYIFDKNQGEQQQDAPSPLKTEKMCPDKAQQYKIEGNYILQCSDKLPTLSSDSNIPYLGAQTCNIKLKIGSKQISHQQQQNQNSLHPCYDVKEDDKKHLMHQQNPSIELGTNKGNNTQIFDRRIQIIGKSNTRISQEFKEGFQTEQSTKVNNQRTLSGILGHLSSQPSYYNQKTVQSEARYKVSKPNENLALATIIRQTHPRGEVLPLNVQNGIFQKIDDFKNEEGPDSLHNSLNQIQKTQTHSQYRVFDSSIKDKLNTSSVSQLIPEQQLKDHQNSKPHDYYRIYRYSVINRRNSLSRKQSHISPEPAKNRNSPTRQRTLPDPITSNYMSELVHKNPINISLEEYGPWQNDQGEEHSTNFDNTFQ